MFLTLVSTLRSYYFHKLRLSHELRDTNLSYLSKDKKAIKKFALQFPLKFLLNISCFDEEAVVKFHNRLKGTKTCCLWVFRKSQNFFKICREEPVLGSFYCKVAACNGLQKITLSTLSKKGRLQGDSYTITFCRF